MLYKLLTLPEIDSVEMRYDKVNSRNYGGNSGMEQSAGNRERVEEE